VNAPHDWIVPDWPAPAGVASLITTRNGGVSGGAFASFNLGLRCGDDDACVQANRARQARITKEQLEEVAGAAGLMK
jgi:copper oxidase (laccase) domain-containing protein